jgi:TatD DNase family protein
MVVDSHAHIDGIEFDADRDEVIQRAHDAGVEAILNVGTGDPHGECFERAISLAENYDWIFAAIGAHPHDARLYNDAAETKILNLSAGSSRVIAWGEIGLDFHYDNSPRNVQMEVFRRQLRTARSKRLPVIVHTREAESETIRILEDEWKDANLPGIMHCFSGTEELAQATVNLGFLISFSGIITFKKADVLREIAKRVPANRLLIETDCPYLTPVPHRGKRNEPAYVSEVARCLAEVREVDYEEVARLTTDNFFSTFGLTRP